jgi:murein L,D-transpeptidase YafK
MPIAQRPTWRRRLLAALAAVVLVSLLVRTLGMTRRATLADRIGQYQDPVRQRLADDFAQAGAHWPAREITFLALKNRKQLQLYVRHHGQWRYVTHWPILAASGQPGPKLREGDHQVPEGIYPAESLNPNSRFHLAVRVGYPNQLDRRIARRQGRTDLGGDIMIHGSNASVGCLAMGDRAAEDIFVLAALAGVENTRILICPVDFRRENLPPPARRNLPAWIDEIYQQLKQALTELPAPPN